MMWWLPNLGGFHGATANGGHVVLTLASSRPQQYAACMQASIWEDNHQPYSLYGADDAIPVMIFRFRVNLMKAYTSCA